MNIRIRRIPGQVLPAIISVCVVMGSASAADMTSLQAARSPSKIIQMFDADGSGTVELRELIVGLGVYCTGTSREVRNWSGLLMRKIPGTSYFSNHVR